MAPTFDNTVAGALITRLTGIEQSQPGFNALWTQTATGLKDHSHARTNQFEVHSQLSGLVEKFSILNREDVATSLQQRLDDLQGGSKWMPEILSLLLLLSDRPVEKTYVEDFAEPAEPSAELTWNEILADAPLTEAEVWDEIERGYHSSGDDISNHSSSDFDPATPTTVTSVEAEELTAVARSYLVQADLTLLEPIRTTKARLEDRPVGNHDPQYHVLSEIDMVRETWTMLHGLPTTLYGLDPNTSTVAVASPVKLTTAMSSTVHDVLAELAQIGSCLIVLRKWCSATVHSTCLQSIQASSLRYLRELDRGLSDIERQYFSSHSSAIVSIVDVRSKIECMTRPLCQLSNHVCHDKAAASNDCENSHGLIDRIYEGVCEAQASGDVKQFKILAEAFFAGAKECLKSAQMWMRSGALPRKDCDSFFVCDGDTTCAHGEAWLKRFAIRTRDSDIPLAPRFILPFVPQTFALGKARAFERLLDGTVDRFASLDAPTHLPKFEQISAQVEADPLLPFSQLVDDAVGDWIQSHAVEANNSLRDKLLHQHGILVTLHIIDEVFFGKDGLFLTAFAEALFGRVKRYRGTWKDPYLLTEIAQSLLDNHVYRTAVHVDLRKHPEDNSKVQTVVQCLADIELTYAVPWPMQNITHTASLPTHSCIFSLILQAHYAKSQLASGLFSLRYHSHRSYSVDIGAMLACKLRQQLLWFVDALQAHLTTTAALLHETMVTELAASDGIDAMAAAWSRYDKRLQVCMLLAENLTPIHEAVVAVLELCEQSATGWGLPTPASSVTEQIDLSSSAVTVKHHLSEFSRLLSFIVTSLQNLSRAHGEPALAALAYRIEWDYG